MSVAQFTNNVENLFLLGTICLGKFNLFNELKFPPNEQVAMLVLHLKLLIVTCSVSLYILVLYTITQTVGFQLAQLGFNSAHCQRGQARNEEPFLSSNL